MMTWNSIFFHSPSSYLTEMVILMHDYVMMFLTATLILVLLKLFYSFSMKNFSMEFFENHSLEFIWTIIPFLVLFLIVLPSLRTLYMSDSCNYCGLALNVMGHQWYWSYYYKDLAQNFFNAYMMPKEESFLRLVDVDNRLILPNFVPVRFLLSSSDVIHSWTIPSLGVKMDAVPGRINQFCFSLSRCGIFFGQCSEICGANHSFMPIVLESISLKDFFNLV